jgi:hypothetical protein
LALPARAPALASRPPRRHHGEARAARGGALDLRAHEWRGRLRAHHRRGRRARALPHGRRGLHGAAARRRHAGGGGRQRGGGAPRRGRVRGGGGAQRRALRHRLRGRPSARVRLPGRRPAGHRHALHAARARAGLQRGRRRAGGGRRRRRHPHPGRGWRGLPAAPHAHRHLPRRAQPGVRPQGARLRHAAGGYARSAKPALSAFFVF